MQLEFMTAMGALGRAARKLGPYLILEIVMPGGTLMALLLFLYQNGKLDFVRDVPRIARDATRAFGRMLEQGSFVLQPCYSWPSERHRRHQAGTLGAFGSLASR